jgi:enoyl-CoA hydratase/carnithine racemase
VSSEISVSTDAGIATIRLDRPAKKNALTVAMYAALADAIGAAEADGNVRVILLHGAGNAFTAGNDLNDFLAAPPDREGAPVFRFLHALAGATKPVVAAVHGVAIGIGTTILLHCDLAVAEEGTRFALPFVDLGLVPEAASSLLLPQQAGYHRAAELLLLGAPFDAATALDAGIVNRVTPAGGALAAAQSFARALADKPPEAVRLTKRLLKSPPEPVAARIAAEGAVFGERLRSPEMTAAVKAFFDRKAARA